MNQIINTFLLARDKFMPETYLKQPRYTYSTCGPFNKNKEIKKTKKKTGDTKHIYKNEIDKVCFQHDMAYRDFKDLARTASDKILRGKEINTAKNTKYDGYHRGLASAAYKFLIKTLHIAVLKMKLNKINN